MAINLLSFSKKTTILSSKWSIAILNLRMVTTNLRWKITSIRLTSGGLRYCGIELFFKRYFGILILMCDVAVSSNPVVCGFSSFWLTVLTVFGINEKSLHGIAVLFIQVHIFK